ncbi:MAG: hypothetical protein ACOYIO_01915 [Eubacteriales bacterium]
MAISFLWASLTKALFITSAARPTIGQNKNCRSKFSKKLDTAGIPMSA